MIYKRIKEENTEFVSTSSVLDYETIATILESFRKEIKRVIDS